MSPAGSWPAACATPTASAPPDGGEGARRDENVEANSDGSEVERPTHLARSTR